ncbi:hypothetical protein TI39_contig610g00008 [Zymoseptoria brevis]|uniref:Uncharacterized protein n=1 Tax=Zymoseptoria brevis TaxID=1047168 RepID=A0A0F4GGR1_9PEZI|nr:hypothetical protein TI39_contig610g00008 [Zymoseptoria brevis]
MQDPKAAFIGKAESNVYYHLLGFIGAGTFFELVNMRDAANCEIISERHAEPLLQEHTSIRLALVTTKDIQMFYSLRVHCPDPKLTSAMSRRQQQRLYESASARIEAPFKVEFAQLMRAAVQMNRIDGHDNWERDYILPNLALQAVEDVDVIAIDADKVVRALEALDSECEDYSKFLAFLAIAGSQLVKMKEGKSRFASDHPALSAPETQGRDPVFPAAYVDGAISVVLAPIISRLLGVELDRGLSMQGWEPVQLQGPSVVSEKERRRMAKTLLQALQSAVRTADRATGQVFEMATFEQVYQDATARLLMDERPSERVEQLQDPHEMFTRLMAMLGDTLRIPEDEVQAQGNAIKAHPSNVSQCAYKQGYLECKSYLYELMVGQMQFLSNGQYVPFRQLTVEVNGNIKNDSLWDLMFQQHLGQNAREAPYMLSALPTIMIVLVQLVEPEKVRPGTQASKIRKRAMLLPHLIMNLCPNCDSNQTGEMLKIISIVAHAGPRAG